jgi:hypothetical protein
MLQLRYLAHSSFEIICGQTRLVTDPWFDGPAYHGQWFLWPLPVENYVSLKPDAILISHGHEDHLHIQTLNKLPKSAKFFFPYQWRAGVKPYLHKIGYSDVTEAVSFKTYKVNDVKITYISFSLESVIIIEYKDEVVVNINDALNSNHANAVDFILNEICKRWPKINYLLSGWSGASYFPNQIRYPGKDDQEIGRLREQFFANNFCRFTHILKPLVSIPFASGFVLLKTENQWINHVKFQRTRVADYYQKHIDKETDILFLVPFPGDLMEKGILKKVSNLHGLSEEALSDMAYKHYARQTEEANLVVYIRTEKVDALVRQLTHWINYNRKLYHPQVTENLVFSIKLSDCEKEAYINVSTEKNKLEVKRSNDPAPNRSLLITSSENHLTYALSKIWGGDVLTIGYGLIIDVYDQLTLEKNLDIVCVRLITRYPIAREDILKFPIRALKFYTYNPRLTTLWLKQKLVLKPYVNKYPYNERDHWLNYNKCDLCAVCKMPEIDLNVYT